MLLWIAGTYPFMSLVILIRVTLIDESWDVGVKLLYIPKPGVLHRSNTSFLGGVAPQIKQTPIIYLTVLLGVVPPLGLLFQVHGPAMLLLGPISCICLDGLFTTVGCLSSMLTPAGSSTGLV